MYRMLSPSAETPDADMGIATPQGTGGRSPPPPAAGLRQAGPPGRLGRRCLGWPALALAWRSTARPGSTGILPLWPGS
eukprot:5685271-Amphidinium_carterae.1